MQELRRILRSTNKIGRSLLISVCGVGELVTTFEKVPGWRKGRGMALSSCVRRWMMSPNVGVLLHEGFHLEKMKGHLLGRPFHRRERS